MARTEEPPSGCWGTVSSFETLSEADGKKKQEEEKEEEEEEERKKKRKKKKEKLVKMKHHKVW